MACRIEVGVKPGFSDPAGDALLRRIPSELLIKGVRSVRVLKAYAIDDELAENELLLLGKELFADPITELFSINKPLFDSKKFSCAIFVGFKPGVKDNAGDTSREAIENLLARKIKGGVYTSRHYLISGRLSAKEIKRIARELLANELIERFEVKTSAEFGEEGFGTAVPRVDIAGGGMINEISLNVPDKELLEISRRRVLSLSLSEMKKIRAYYDDPDIVSERSRQAMPAIPTDVELECLAQTWSEHCKHKIFNAKITLMKGRQKRVINSIFRSYIRASTEKLRKKKKWLVSVFTDNAGIFEFVPGWNVAMKVETHNTPSALDPFGGALTGILGVNRDVLGCGLGAKPIFNTDIFCFADPYYKGEIPPRLFHPRRVLEGVRAGVAHGGNASGIPTINGSLYFDERYLGKPLVYCGTGGIMPSVLPDGRKSHEKKAQPGDRIFMAGGRIGKDGIHGATFSSVELHESSPVSAVQIGDPYTQKKLSDFLLEARDLGLYNSVTDNGAGGLSSSVGEMSESSGGVKLHLDRAPLKYVGLDPWEILVSESQERMTFAVPPAKAGDFVQLARLRGVEVSDLGQFTSSGFFHVLYGAKTVAYLEMEFLHHGVPQLVLDAELHEKKLAEPSFSQLGIPAPLATQANAKQQKKGKKGKRAKEDEKAALQPPAQMQHDFGSDLLSLLSRPNICSKEYIIRQYDHEVQGSSVVKPLCGKKMDGPSDAGVIAPLFERKEGLVVSNGICSRYSDIDAYQMAANALDEAIRNYVAAGGSLDRCSALDNFCWADPIASPDNAEGKHRLAQLVATCQGLYEGCLEYGVPLISGKDSMKNDYKYGKWRISVPPTLLVSAIGRIDDVSLAVASDFKSDGDAIYVLGETNDELGGSEYYAMKGQLGANVPKVNFRKNFALYRKLENAIKKKLIASCHDLSDGGLAVALAECCIGGDCGAEVELGQCTKKLAPHQFLFSESSGRFIVTVHKKDEPRFRQAMRGAAFERIGAVSKKRELSLSLSGQRLISLPLEKLATAWKKPMDW